MIISGDWQQGGYVLPLELNPAADTVARRPQEPKEPYPYKVQDVRYPNKSAGIKLAGTLTIPAGSGPFPAVILVSGSGPQDRNEYLMGHKPFLVLADYLTRRGIAVLRSDDRGIGESTGDFSTATAEDFTGDALSAVRFLKNRKNMDPHAVGLISHSEGGLIAPMASVKSKDISFIVLMAGTGLIGKEILYLQTEKILRVMGISEDLITKNRILQGRLFDILRSTVDDTLAKKELISAMKEEIAAMTDEEKDTMG